MTRIFTWVNLHLFRLFFWHLLRLRRLWLLSDLYIRLLVTHQILKKAIINKVWLITKFKIFGLVLFRTSCKIVRWIFKALLILLLKNIIIILMKQLIILCIWGRHLTWVPLLFLFCRCYLFNLKEIVNFLLFLFNLIKIYVCLIFLNKLWTKTCTHVIFEVQKLIIRTILCTMRLMRIIIMFLSYIKLIRICLLIFIVSLCMICLRDLVSLRTLSRISYTLTRTLRWSIFFFRWFVLIYQYQINLFWILIIFIGIISHIKFDWFARDILLLIFYSFGKRIKRSVIICVFLPS